MQSLVKTSAYGMHFCTRHRSFLTFPKSSQVKMNDTAVLGDEKQVILFKGKKGHWILLIGW